MREDELPVWAREAMTQVAGPIVYPPYIRDMMLLSDDLRKIFIHVHFTNLGPMHTIVMAYV